MLKVVLRAVPLLGDTLNRPVVGGALTLMITLAAVDWPKEPNIYV
jgi:hypothetical protein